MCVVGTSLYEVKHHQPLPTHIFLEKKARVICTSKSSSSCNSLFWGFDKLSKQRQSRVFVSIGSGFMMWILSRTWCVIDFIKAIKAEQQFWHHAGQLQQLHRYKMSRVKQCTLQTALSQSYINNNQWTYFYGILISNFPSLSVILWFHTGRAGRSWVYFHSSPVSLCPVHCSVHRAWRVEIVTWQGPDRP